MTDALREKVTGALREKVMYALREKVTSWLEKVISAEGVTVTFYVLGSELYAS